ncbi:sigma-70 family RNA polymerase sigma factor [Bacillus sp. 1P06AnD]|uniref:sigma-70 family RNA polymerase sigma factor n=1 Tax=Bacillus sp. 1P06AnD TaxID=3132208 RepID=UPI0039A38917
MEGKIDLIYKAKNGDVNAFQTLIHREKEKLYRIAFVYMRNEEESLEVFQETMYKALKSLSKLKKEEYFSTWITRILINTAISQLRKKKYTVPLNQEVLERLNPILPIDADEKMDLLKALDEIEEKYKTVLILRYYQDYTVNQISEVLGCPEGTVKTNIKRGLNILKNTLKGEYSDVRKNSVV